MRTANIIFAVSAPSLTPVQALMGAVKEFYLESLAPNLSTLSIVFAVIGLYAGLYAAYLWLKSSKVKPVPSPQIGTMEADLAQMEWLCAMMKANQEAAELNGKAAGWTALAVVSAAISNFTSIVK